VSDVRARRLRFSGGKSEDTSRAQSKVYGGRASLLKRTTAQQYIYIYIVYTRVCVFDALRPRRRLASTYTYIIYYYVDLSLSASCYLPRETTRLSGSPWRGTVQGPRFRVCAHTYIVLLLMLSENNNITVVVAAVKRKHYVERRIWTPTSFVRQLQQQYIIIVGIVGSRTMCLHIVYALYSWPKNLRINHYINNFTPEIDLYILRFQRPSGIY